MLDQRTYAYFFSFLKQFSGKIHEIKNAHLNELSQDVPCNHCPSQETEGCQNSRSPLFLITNIYNSLKSNLYPSCHGNPSLPRLATKNSSEDTRDRCHLFFELYANGITMQVWFQIQFHLLNIIHVRGSNVVVFTCSSFIFMAV